MTEIFMFPPSLADGNHCTVSALWARTFFCYICKWDHVAFLFLFHAYLVGIIVATFFHAEEIAEFIFKAES